MSQSEMDCKSARERFALMLYGELSFDEEERVDSHMDGCEECRAAFAKERAMHAAFDSAAAEVSPSLLYACREDLRAKLASEPVPEPVKYSWWDRAIDLLTLRSSDRS